MRPWLRRSMCCLVAFLAVTSGACSDDGDPPGEETPDFCSEDTLSVALNDPEPAEGFAPLDVTVQGQVRLIEDVQFTWTISINNGPVGVEVAGDGQPNVNQILSEPGTYFVELNVSDTTCAKFYTDTAEIRVLQPVELSGEDLIARPGNIQAGDPLAISMDVVNSVEVPVEVPVTVAFYLSQRADLRWDELETLRGLTNVTLSPGPVRPAIAAGPNGRAVIAEEVVVPENVADGPYYVVAAIDPFNTIAEEDEEGNNLVVSSAPVFVQNLANSAPDLVATNVQVGPTSAFLELSELSLNVNLRNIGTLPGTAPYSVFIQPGDGAFDEAVAREVFTSESLMLDSLPPGDAFNVRAQTITIDPAEVLPEGVSEQEVCVWVWLDPEDAVEESDESNNLTRTETCVLVTDEPFEGIDITINDFQMTPTNTFLDGAVDVTLEVANVGTARSSSFFCRLYLSEDDSLELDADDLLSNINFSALDPNQSSVVETRVLVPGFLPVGTFEVFVFCDPSNVIMETFEDNNSARLGEPLTIIAEPNIDLVPRGVSFDTLTLEDGATLTASMTVANQGATGSSVAEARVLLASDGACDENDPVLGSAVVPPLDPMGEAPLELIIEGVQCELFVSDYRLCVFIDSADPEVNLSNNLVRAEEPFTISGERCACEDDPLEPNDAPVLASVLTPGVQEGLTLCEGGQVDFFAIALEAGQSAQVRLTQAYDERCANLNVAMLTPTFQTIPDAVSATDSPVEQANLFLAEVSGDYIIRVDGDSECDIGRYDLDVVISSPSEGTDLLGADLVVDDAAPAIAAEVTASFRTLNAGVVAAEPYEVTLVLSQDEVFDGEDLVLTTVTIEQGLAGIRERSDDISFAIPEEAGGGQWYVCAMLDSGEVIDEDNEDNNTLCGPRLVTDDSCFDALEFNDTLEAAVDIEPGVFSDLNVCDLGRSDHYRFCVEADRRFEVRLDFVHREGDVELRLRRDEAPEFPQVETSAGVRDFESIVVEYVEEPTCYIAEVFLNDRNTNRNDYDLTLDVQPGDPALRCDRALEPNNTPEEAAPLINALQENLVLDRCPRTDFDYYSVDLAAGAEVTFCAENALDNVEPVSLALSLLDPAFNQLATDIDASPCVTRQILVSGRYTLRLLTSGSDARAVRYTLSAEGLQGVDLAGAALTLTPTTVRPGDLSSVISYDFMLGNRRLDAVSDVSYGVYYSTDPVIEPDVDLLLETVTVPSVPGLGEVRVQGSVLLPLDPAVQAGEGTIGVFIDPEGAIDEASESNNRLQASVEVLICDDDILEGNQSQSTAAPLTLGVPVNNLTLCPATSDWYCASGLLPGDYSAEAIFTLDAEARVGTDLNIELLVDEGEGFEAAGADVSLTDGAQVDFSVSAEATACMRIFGLRDFSSNDYSAQFSVR